MSKPSKSPNFTAIKKSVVLDLVESREGIIKSKQNDRKTILKKSSVLEKITAEFNASDGVIQGKCTQLMTLWKNMKTRTKSAIAKTPKERTKNWRESS